MKVTPEQIRDYDTADAYLMQGRDPDDRPLPGNSTRLQRETNPHGTGQINVRYHATSVVSFYPDGGIRLRHGDWRSKTTADRIEEYTGGRVSGRIDTTQSWYREVLRHGPTDWSCEMRDGQVLEVTA